MPRASQAENERFNLSAQKKKIHFFTITLTFLRAAVAGVTPACSSVGFISFVIFSTSLIHIQRLDNMFFIRYSPSGNAYLADVLQIHLFKLEIHKR